MSGRIVRPVFVVECGNCGAWSKPAERAEDAGADDTREVDGVTYCRPCGDDIEGDQ